MAVNAQFELSHTNENLHTPRLMKAAGKRSPRSRSSVTVVDARVTHAPKAVTAVKDRRLTFGDKWDYAPAPESVAVKIECRYELFVDGKFVATRGGKYFP